MENNNKCPFMSIKNNCSNCFYVYDCCMINEIEIEYKIKGD